MIDVHYSGMAWGTAYEVYTQLMNEDFEPDHAFGHQPPVRRQRLATGSRHDAAADGRIHRQHRRRGTSSASATLYSGFAYNNYDYVDGMRYRGRTLGFSLDSDSRLASLQASWIDNHDWTYTLTYHHAWISSPTKHQLAMSSPPRR